MMQGIEEFERNKKIGIYARVSTDDQAKEGYSIDAQIRKGKSYIELYEFNTVSVKIYIEDGKSGKTISKRKALKELMTDISDNKIDTVIIYRLDRLSRNVKDIYYLIDFFVSHNCSLISIHDKLDIHSAVGRVLVGILAVFAQFESEVIAERTLSSRVEMLTQGKYPFALAPYGTYKDEKMFLHVNEKEKIIINKVIDLLIEGIPLMQVVKDICLEFDVKIRYEMIRSYLKRDWAFGVLNHNDMKWTNIIPAIDTKERVLKAREMLYKRKTYNSSDKYYFRNKVYCTCGCICEQESTNKPKVKYYYYVCPRCGKRINQNIILNQTLYKIIDKVNNDEKKELNKKDLKKIDKIEYRLRIINDDYAVGKIDINQYTAISYNLKQQKLQLLKKIKFYKEREIVWDILSDQDKTLFIETYIINLKVNLDMKLVVELNLKDATIK